MPESPKSQPSSAKNPPSPGKKRKASSAAKAVSFFMDALAEKVPQQIRIDLDKQYERASKLNKEEAKISKDLRDDKYKFPEVPPFDPKEAKAPGYTPILTSQGSYTAIWKSNAGDDDEEDDEEDDGSGSEEDDSEEEKPPPAKKAKPSRSSSYSSGDGNTATL
ncbi:hypothetical protein PF001_g20491 [Phytophthora fragariae]|uniref:Uncharacterized protein n=1 Tax=Phytophthora fragariae TaxID=53985 RepID=A0A6A4CBG9_9STRA|nr:hypothetical protein PF001_g20491 [Phytophthora fragariae]